MKKYLLILLCLFLLMGCASSVKTNTLVGVGVGETEIQTLPVTADLAVSDRKVIVEVNGKVTNLNGLTQEALAKALGQEQPSVNSPDVLVGQHSFTESNGNDIKVTLTGYPAWYTNFRTATRADSLRLNMVSSGPTPDNKPKVGNVVSGGDWYFNIKYQFGDYFGWGLGVGKVWPSSLLKGEFFAGLEFEEGNLLSPWKESCDDYWESSYHCSQGSLGGGINIGGIYGELPNDLKLVYGLSLGFWFSRNSKDYQLIDPLTGWSTYVDENKEEYLFAGPFVKLRWNGLELGLRLLLGTSESRTYGYGGDNYNDESAARFQFSIGYTY